MSRRTQVRSSHAQEVVSRGCPLLRRRSPPWLTALACRDLQRSLHPSSILIRAMHALLCHSVPVHPLRPAPPPTLTDANCRRRPPARPPCQQPQPLQAPPAAACWATAWEACRSAWSSRRTARAAAWRTGRWSARRAGSGALSGRQGRGLQRNCGQPQRVQYLHQPNLCAAPSFHPPAALGCHLLNSRCAPCPSLPHLPPHVWPTRRCPSLFLASWGYQCVTWDGRACCRKPDGRSCRSLEHWEHAEHPEGWQGTDADSSQPGADAAVDPKAAEKVEVKAGGRAGSRLRALSTEDAPAGSHASSSNTEPTADSDSASTDAGSAADDGEPESQDSDSDCSSGTSSDAADAEDVEEEQEQDDGPTSYNEAKWGKGDGKDGKGSERSTSDDYGDGKDGGVSAERREEEGEGRARRHSRKERGGRRRDDDDDSGSGRKRGKRSSGSGWRRAAATHYTSYPPCCHDRSVDQSECADYSGCKWEGMVRRWASTEAGQRSVCGRACLAACSLARSCRACCSQPAAARPPCPPYLPLLPPAVQGPERQAAQVVGGGQQHCGCVRVSQPPQPRGTGLRARCAGGQG